MLIEDFIAMITKAIPAGCEIGVASAYAIATDFEIKCVRATKPRTKRGLRYGSKKATSMIFVLGEVGKMPEDDFPRI